MARGDTSRAVPRQYISRIAQREEGRKGGGEGRGGDEPGGDGGEEGEDGGGEALADRVEAAG